MVRRRSLLLLRHIRPERKKPVTIYQDPGGAETAVAELWSARFAYAPGVAEKAQSNIDLRLLVRRGQYCLIGIQDKMLHRNRSLHFEVCLLTFGKHAPEINLAIPLEPIDRNAGDQVDRR